jgi:hypothetical protein
MNFICEFADPDDVAATMMEIPVRLTADDLAELDRICERQKERDEQNLPRDTDVNIVPLAMALRIAYQLAPEGYTHLQDGVHPVPKPH